jgi:hypothetical protein
MDLEGMREAREKIFFVFLSHFPEKVPRGVVEGSIKHRRKGCDFRTGF